MQAMCDFRGLDLYVFFTGGELLDAPKWEMLDIYTEGMKADADADFDFSAGMLTMIDVAFSLEY